MKTNFAIYQVTNYEVKTPLGPRQVRQHTRVGLIKQDIPDEVAAEVAKHPQFNSESFFEGVGQVLVQTNRGVFPQPVGFVFGEEVTTFQQAYDKFDEYMQKEIKRLQQEANDQRSALAIAPEGVLRQLDAQREKSTKGGILLP